MCLCPKPPGYHPTDSGPAQSAQTGYRQNLPERKWLCCFWEVRSNLQHAHPIPDISFHSDPYNSVCPAISNHSDTQVRAQCIFAVPALTSVCQRGWSNAA